MIDLLTTEEARKIPGDILRCKAPMNFNGYIDEENKLEFGKCQIMT